MELHCHWPVQTTKMEERNGGFHGEITVELTFYLLE